MKEINPRQGAIVCAAREDGAVVRYTPAAYDGYKQGDTPQWAALQSKKDRQTGKQRRPEHGNRGRNENQGRAGAHPR